MTSVREQIFAEIETRLAAIGDAMETERMPTSDPGAFPARHIFDGDQRTLDGDTSAARYQLSLSIDGYIEQFGTAGAHGAANDLYAETIAALFTEPPLGGLAETIEEGDCRFTAAPLAAEERLAFSLDLTVTFVTARGDPRTLP